MPRPYDVLMCTNHQSPANCGRCPMSSEKEVQLRQPMRSQTHVLMGRMRNIQPGNSSASDVRVRMRLHLQNNNITQTALTTAWITLKKRCNGNEKSIGWWKFSGQLTGFLECREAPDKKAFFARDCSKTQLQQEATLHHLTRNDNCSRSKEIQ